MKKAIKINFERAGMADGLLRVVPVDIPDALPTVLPFNYIGEGEDLSKTEVVSALQAELQQDNVYRLLSVSL